jgi:hypothetical protein
MRYAVEIGSVSMIHNQNFIKFRSGTQKFIRREGYTDSKVIS